jgi:hypothetical protein
MVMQRWSQNVMAATLTLRQATWMAGTAEIQSIVRQRAANGYGMRPSRNA